MGYMNSGPYSESNLEEIEEKLGIKIDRRLLKIAISTNGAKNEYPILIEEFNGRLEFLGDSVLKLLISEYLYNDSREPQGTLTRKRNVLEKNIKLGIFAKNILNIKKENLFLSQGEKKLTGSGEISILSNAMEALIGAIYLSEGNLGELKKFIKKYITSELEDKRNDSGKNDYKDPKTRLNEYSLRLYNKPPEYCTKRIGGEDDYPIYRSIVYIDDEKIAEGEGRNTKEAEMDAAKKALEILGQ